MFFNKYPNVFLHTGDAAAALTHHFPAAVDIFLLSPPYDTVTEEYKTLLKKTRQYEEGYTWDFCELANAMWNSLTEGGVIIWNIDDRHFHNSETSTPERQKLYFQDVLGAKVETIIVRQEGVGAKGANDLYWQGFEYIYLFSKGKKLRFNPIEDKVNSQAGRITSGERPQYNGDKRIAKNRTIPQYSKRTNVWVVSPQPRNTNGHPAPMDLTLAKDLLYSFADQGCVICDPMLGSGTSAVAALEVFGPDVHFWGIDSSEKYVQAAAQRIEALELGELYDPNPERPQEKQTVSIRDHFMHPIDGTQDDLSDLPVQQWVTRGGI